jgi:hypothetical protein
MKLATLSLALIGTALMSHAPSAAAVVAGDTYVCRVTLSKGCPATHTDGNTVETKALVPNTKYKSIQWIGKAVECTSATDDDDGSKDGYCTVTFTYTSAVATTWKLGFKVSITGKISDITSVTGEVNGEYGKILTDSDGVSIPRKIPVGYTDRIYSYVYRDEYALAFKGYWSKGSGYRCGFLNAYTCYQYTWSSLVAAYASALVAESGQQTFTFARYKNGSSSGLVVDDDN